MDSFDILALGEALVDLISVEQGSALDDVATFRRYLGGAPINVAATAARLGRRSAVVARVGDDAFGRFVQAEIRRLGVAAEFVQVDGEHITTLALVASTTGSPDFLIVRGADQFLDGSTLDAALAGARALHISMFALSREPCRTTAISAIRAAHAAGKVVSLDPNFRERVWADRAALPALLAELCPLTTLLKPSLDDAAAIFGPGQTPAEYLAHFHRAGARQVLLTLGKEGVLASDGTTATHLAATPLPIADATGAGDSFTAGAILALLAGRDLVSAARIGQRVAHAKLQAVGHSAPLPSWESLLATA